MPMRSAPPGEPRATAAGADVAIVFALPVEADAFERLALNRVATRGARFAFATGLIADHRVAWCVSGVGQEAAAGAARQLIDGHRPRLLVTAGFAGGLDPTLRRGAVLRPDVAITVDRLARIQLVASARHAGVEPETAIVTVDAVAATAAAKQALAARTGARLVDMETFAVAATAQAAGLPCAAVRVISDEAGETLPAEVAALAAPQSPWRRLGAAARVVARRPAAAADLWGLWERSVVDSRTLATAVAATIDELA